MTPETMAEGRRLSENIDKGIHALREAAAAEAHAEHAYRQAKAEAWVTVDRWRDDAKRLAAEIEADVQAVTADARLVRDLAAGTRQAALEALRSRRQQLSAWQTAVSADRSEAEFARTGPEYQP